MKKISLLLLALTVLFCSCSKDDEALDRDKFIGVFTGTMNIELTASGITPITDTSSETIEIMPGGNDNQVLISGLNESAVTAIISGNSISIPEYNCYLSVDGTDYSQFAFSGNGVLSSNNVLTITLSGETIYQGVDLYVDIVGSLNKN